MPKIVMLVFAVICIFGVVAAIMIRVMPGPLKDSDFLVIGTTATIVSVLALFFGLIATTHRSRDTFFKRRKKQQ